MINGRAFKPTDWQETGLPIVRIKNLNSINALFNFCDDRRVEERHLINSGSFLISCSGTPGTSFGAFIWERGKAALNQHIFKCSLKRNVYFDKFLRIAINGRLDEMIAKAHGGVGLQHITKGKLESLILPLPPLAEQHRIVAKVDELMKLCDDLEAAQTKRERRRDRLVTSTLHGLNNGDQLGNVSFPLVGNPSEERLRTSRRDLSFLDSARFYFNHLPRLTTRLEHIQQLRRTILNLAAWGKLVPQDPKEEPVDVLISQIERERKRRIKKGDAVTIQEPAAKGAGRYSIPKSWRWVRLGFATNVIMGQSPPGATYNKRGKGIPLFNGPIEFSEGPFGITVINQFTTAPNKVCKKNDFLLCVRGSTTGRTNVAGFDACIGRGVAALQPMFADQFVRLFVWSWREQIIEMGRGIAFPSISRQQIEGLPIPFPPLAGQHRIVAKMDDLMALCDEVETRITTNTTTSRKLLEATLEEAIN